MANKINLTGKKDRKISPVFVTNNVNYKKTPAVLEKTRTEHFTLEKYEEGLTQGGKVSHKFHAIHETETERFFYEITFFESPLSVTFLRDFMEKTTFKPENPEEFDYKELLGHTFQMELGVSAKSNRDDTYLVISLKNFMPSEV